MKEFEEKMDAKFNRLEEEEAKPVPEKNESRNALENPQSDSYDTAHDRTLKICVDSHDGDKVRVNLPLKFGRMILSKGSRLSGRWTENLNQEDINMMMEMIDKGHIGEIVNVESADGDTVVIKVV